MKVGVADGFDNYVLASMVGSYSSDLHCATDLDSFKLIGNLGYVEHYDILHISGFGCDVSGFLGRPKITSTSNPIELVELSLEQIKSVLDITEVEPRLVILDTPPLAEDDEEYCTFLKERRIRAILHYLTPQPSQSDREYFLPRFLEAVLKGRRYDKAIETGTMRDEKKLDLRPKIVFNERLLGLHKTRHEYLSLVYPD